MRRGGGALLLAAALAAAGVGCSDPREAELASELAGLQESRVPKASRERMQGEAEAAEARAAELGPEVDALRAEIDAGRGAIAALEAAMQRELARNQELNREIAAAQASLQGASERLASLEEEVARQRARAQTFVDQAEVLSRELRAGDPDWAVRLRMRTLEEFLTEVRTAWPRDPVLADVTRRPLPPDEREATRVGAGLAARVAERVARVYELGPREESAEAPPAVSAEPPAS